MMLVSASPSSTACGGARELHDAGARRGEICCSDRRRRRRPFNGPCDAEFRRLVRYDLDDDRLDQYLGPPDIELVDDLHQGAHHFRRCVDDDGVGLGVRSLGGGYLALEVLLQLGGQFFRIGVAQIAHLGITAVFERRVEVRDQRPQPQAIGPVAAYQYAVGTGIRDETRRHRRAVGTLLGQRRQHANDLGR